MSKETDIKIIDENLRILEAQQIFNKLGNWDITRTILRALHSAKHEARETNNQELMDKFSEMIEVVGTAYGMRKT